MGVPPCSKITNRSADKLSAKKRKSRQQDLRHRDNTLYFNYSKIIKFDVIGKIRIFSTMLVVPSLRPLFSGRISASPPMTANEKEFHLVLGLVNFDHSSVIFAPPNRVRTFLIWNEVPSY
jgi:hypothetical protein